MTDPLTPDMIKKAAESLGVEPAALDAVCRVEAAGSGFLPSGRPKILFEGHIFWRELRKEGHSEAELQKLAEKHPEILHKNWTRQHYRIGEKEYGRLEDARKISETAANAAASWGAFQIMGMNHAACGFADVATFVEAQCRDSASQLDTFCAFIRHEGLTASLKARDWPTFARRYNGPGYAENAYDKKLAEAYRKSLAARGSG